MEFSNNAKAELLADRSKQKVDNLSSYTNTLSGEKLQLALSDVVNQQVYTDDKGSYQLLNVNHEMQRVPFEGKTRNLYIDNTKDNNYKLGLAKDSFKNRYTPELGGWSPGDKGVTVNNGPLMDIKLPYDTATTFEHKVHSNIGQIANRAIGIDPTYEDKQAFGSGHSEYTLPTAPLWDDRVKIPTSLSGVSSNTYIPELERDFKSVIYEDIAKTSEEYKNRMNEQAKASQNSSMVNTLKALPAGILDVASGISKSPKNLYEYLGGDYLEKNSTIAKEYPTYAKAVKNIIDVTAKASEYIDYTKTDTLGYDPKKQELLQKDIGKAFDDGNYVTGIVGAVARNPAGAIEMGMNMYGFSKAMAAKGGAGVPAIVGSFADNANEAQKIYKKEYGEDAAGDNLAVITGLAAVGTAMDTLAAKWMFSKTRGDAASKALGKAVGNLISKVPSKVAQTALGGSAKIASYMGVEAFQEGFTEAAIVAGGTQDLDKFLNDKYQKRIYEASAMGGIAGPGMKAADVVVEAPFKYKEISDSIKTEIDRRKLLKEETEHPLESTEGLSKKYGGIEAVATKEAEYHQAIDTAISSNDISTAIDTFQEYYNDYKNDAEKVFSTDEFTSRYKAIKQLSDALSNDIIEGKVDKVTVDKFGSSPDMIDISMEDMSIDRSEQFLDSYSKNYGSENINSLNRIKQNIEVKKSLEEVGKDIAKDIQSKGNAVKEVKSISKKEDAIKEFNRFKIDRLERSNRLDNWIAEKERSVMKEATEETAKGKSLEEVLTSLAYPKTQKDDYTYTTKDIHTTENKAQRSDIAKRLLDKELKKPEDQWHARGIYALTGTKTAELKAFNNMAILLDIDTKVEEQAVKEEREKLKQDIKGTVKEKVNNKKVVTAVKEKVNNNDLEKERISYEKQQSKVTAIEDIKGSTKPTKELVTAVKEKVNNKKVVTETIGNFTIDTVDILLHNLENTKANINELNKYIQEIFEYGDDFKNSLSQYQKDINKLETEKELIKLRIKRHKDEIARYKLKLAIAIDKKKIINKYSKDGLDSLRYGKQIAKNVAQIVRNIIVNINNFKNIINKHQQYIKNFKTEIFILNREIRTLKREMHIKSPLAKYSKLKEHLKQEQKDIENTIKNYVSKSIIAESKLQTRYKNILTTKNSISKLAIDPKVGEQISTILETLNKNLSYKYIQNIIDKKFKNVASNEELEFKKSIDNDPVRVLFNKEGNLHPNVIAAISKSLLEYLMKYGTNMLQQDPKQIAQMLGYGDNVESMPTKALEVIGTKTFKKNIADVLGKTIMNDLGLKVDPKAETRLRKEQKDNPSMFFDTTIIEDLNDKFIASLGQIAAIIGGEIGIFTEVDNISKDNQITNKEYAEIAANLNPKDIKSNLTIDLVGIGSLGKKLISNKDMYTTLNKIIEEFTEDTYLKEVRNKPISKNKEIKQKVDTQVFNVPQLAKDVISKARKQTWRLDLEAIKLFKELDELPDNKNLIKKFIGYKESSIDSNNKEFIPELAFVDSQNQIAKNNSIKLKLKLLDNLITRLENAPNSDLFYEYFYGANGRFYVDNNEVNAQNDIFNRFMMGLASNEVEVNLNDEEAKSTITFYVALAQAFGKDIDKMSLADSVKAGKELANMKSDDLVNMIKDPEFKPEAIGHALQGILAVRSKENSKENIFKTNLVIETDAVTSGIILKLLQLPLVGSEDNDTSQLLQNTKTLLKKGGILFEGDENYETFNGTNELIAKGQLDLYKTMAQEYSKTITNYLKNGNWLITPKKDKVLTSGQKYINKRRKLILDVIEADTSNSIIPIFETDGSKIKGTLRNIFKPVVMVFGYGGGITSIKRKFISDIIEELPTKLLKERMAVQNALRNGGAKPDTPILDLIKAVAPDIRITLRDIREKDILNTVINGTNTTIREVLVKDMTALYGDNLSTTLENVFGSKLVNANKTLNNSFRMMFRVFNYKYQKSIEDFKRSNEGRNPTVEEKAELILQLKDSFPAFTPPLAKDSEKGIIIDTKVDASIQVSAQTLGTFNRINPITGKKQKTISVATVVKEFEEAISAGNVIPIHYIDASIMGKTFLDIDGVTQVFDALISNLSNAFDGNKRYNELVVEISKEYTLVDKVLESLQQSINTLTPTELKEFLDESNLENNKFTIEEKTPVGDNYLTIKHIENKMIALVKEVKEARIELFKSKIKSDHMTGLGAVVEIDSADNVITKENIEADKEILQINKIDRTPAVDSKDINPIISGNKAINRLRKEAIKEECKS